MSTADVGLGMGNPLAEEVGTRSSGTLLVSWFAVHVVVWIGLVSLVPGDDAVDYTDLGALGTPWIRQFIIPLLVVLLLQVVAITRLGWWSSVLRDPQRTVRRWMWFPVIVIIWLTLGAFASSGISTEAGASYLIGCAVTVVLVGVTEEITFRGVLVVGMRRTFAHEWQAVAVASALFGLFHTPNIVLGADVSDALRQTVFTAVMGAGFYCLRRVRASLLPCIVLHAVYDFALVQASWDTLITR